ncbi:SRPBCC domain-containing protein [Sphingobacterium humi]|uniref:SRPBCC domain-containing protein n=1 Tax=Sphingobacterium humi TaxID=1796905 RepID=A0A6N8L1P0_9SPHI|nr:SRPBCC domain-containing protein [Sphingobacterium humi]MVZ62068.1 SRPBCC domain-containing protein [Sphingobacterium humi]
MKTLYFNISINASPEKVHELMLAKPSYQQWTKAFSPSSSYQGDWSEGFKIFFVSTEDEQVDSGMIARVEKNTAGDIVIIRHMGVLSKEGELYEGPGIDDWKNALEIYRFKAENGGTNLLCSLELNSTEHEAMFAEMWPKALIALKEICEK